MSKTSLDLLDKLADEMASDPEGLRRRLEAKLIAERGQEWFDANKKFIDADWEYAAQVFGFTVAPVQP